MASPLVARRVTNVAQRSFAVDQELFFSVKNRAKRDAEIGTIADGPVGELLAVFMLFSASWARKVPACIIALYGLGRPGM
jgi:hypothetical protein